MDWFKINPTTTKLLSPFLPASMLPQDGFFLTLTAVKFLSPGIKGNALFQVWLLWQPHIARDAAFIPTNSVYKWQPKRLLQDRPDGSMTLRTLLLIIRCTVIEIYCVVCIFNPRPHIVVKVVSLYVS